MVFIILKIMISIIILIIIIVFLIIIGQYIFFQEKFGWYTEKICDNWYYYEEDWDHFNFINYIKDDLKHMKEYNEIYNRFTEYFDD